MIFLGTILMNGMGYAVYGPRGTTPDQVWDRHVRFTFGDDNSGLFLGADVRLVALSDEPPAGELPDDYTDSLRGRDE